MKILFCLVLALVCQQVFSHKYHGYHNKGKLMRRDGEVLRIDVKEVQVKLNSKGIQDEKWMKVDLKIVYKDGRISVNGIPIQTSTVMSFQTPATVVDINPQKNEINKRRVPVLVRVLANRRYYRQGWKKSSRLFLEQQIISVDGNKVTQINIKEMILELGCRGNKFVYYRLHDKKPEDSEIHHRNPGNDRPYNGDKDHESRPETFPEEAVNAFEKLPMPARIAIYVGSGFLALLILFGLYKLCCRSSSSRSAEQTYVDNVKLVYNPNMEQSEKPEKPEKPEKLENKPEVKQAFEEVVIA
ncbi:uncharacterized protein TRIADDRAFT_63958 [Trichoplax adhaerens]|uniref:Expressed protein n=1 Tax=Trichoplax adhaerens TaxID=10228 RepID=B3RYB6_TRIAD|nr:expressed protein [Trichoplax adhaerens]EDV25008.1 expressed protein [Trichoplax adhaerens]|eukprot:XP_002112898.1 expressed protein [Trichoplax adhaerens]